MIEAWHFSFSFVHFIKFFCFKLFHTHTHTYKNHFELKIKAMS